MMVLEAVYIVSTLDGRLKKCSELVVQKDKDPLSVATTLFALYSNVTQVHQDGFVKLVLGRQVVFCARDEEHLCFVVFKGNVSDKIGDILSRDYLARSCLLDGSLLVELRQALSLALPLKGWACVVKSAKKGDCTYCFGFFQGTKVVSLDVLVLAHSEADQNLIRKVQGWIQDGERDTLSQHSVTVIDFAEFALIVPSNCLQWIAGHIDIIRQVAT